MNKLSDKLDFLDKAMDLHNYFIESQRQAIINEIVWLELNEQKPINLRSHFLQLLSLERVAQISDKELQQLAEMRGNYLYSQLCGLGQQKIENKPLKIIVQQLKNSGQ